MSTYNVVAASNESTVVTEYEPQSKRSDAYQSEAALEQAFIRMLEEQGYAYLPIHDNADLVANLRRQLLGDAFQIAKAIPVGIIKGFRVNLVDNLVLEIVHCKPHLHSEPNQATPFFLPMATVSTKGTTIAINMHSAKLSI